MQKIIKVGNSAALTLPRDFLVEAGLRIGDEMAVETNAKMKMFLAKPKEQAAQKTLTPEFKNWLDDFIKEYRPVLKKLARM